MNLKFLTALAFGLAAYAVVLSGDLAARDQGENLLVPRQTCTSPAPSKGNVIQVNLILFSDSGCCNQVATDSEAFELEAKGGFCNQVGGSGFQSLRQAVGQDVFGRNLRIFAFASSDCSGAAGIIDLSNNFVCDQFGGGMHSFSIQT